MNQKNMNYAIGASMIIGCFFVVRAFDALEYKEFFLVIGAVFLLIGYGLLQIPGDLTAQVIFSFTRSLGHIFACLGGILSVLAVLANFLENTISMIVCSAGMLVIGVFIEHISDYAINTLCSNQDPKQEA